ncbi:hypothetical protein C1752_08642 [Acaryochloris thomasi RCC1774]|uniref:Uncharacterized protein n=1 Tax=Acaryochloris thomasi RCC1774 TaxID=1764569 RepID=A0A2W1JP08_9CYAN|nr:hypothetical protein [Acaryochloris thomasi]PZD70981.1 hypothetical protein C1752_08642 [Acaryochloris thomasi RCC1774]
MSPSPPEPSIPRDLAIVKVSPETDALVERDMPDAEESVKQETKNLVEALKRKAQAEVQGAQNVALDTYLAAVQTAKEAVNETQLIDPKQIERSANLLAQDAQDNWQGMVDEMTLLGDRLAEAAQAAWDVLTRPK